MPGAGCQAIRLSEQSDFVALKGVDLWTALRRRMHTSQGCGEVEALGVGSSVQRFRTSSFRAADCCGCLNGILEGDQARTECNECYAVVRTVPSAALDQTLHEMELSLDLSSALCPHCGAVNMFPGFSKVFVFVCKECERGVELSD